MTDPVRSVVVVGANYWPEPTGNAVYTTPLAEHFASCGIRVSVLTGVPYYPQWRVPDGYGRAWSRERLNGVDVLRVRMFVPAGQSAIKRALFEGSFLSHALLRWRIPRPDAILGVVPTLSGGVLARWLSRRYRVPYGLVFQDLVGAGAEQSGMPGGSGVAKVVRSAEGWVARRAAAVAVVSEGFSPYLLELGVKAPRLTYLPNWSHIAISTADCEETRGRLDWAPGRQVVLHSGSMGLKLGLEQVVDIARFALGRGANCLFVLMGDGSERRALQERAQGLSNVRFLPPSSPSEFPDVLAAADVLLVSERASAVNMSLPSKLTSYFASGRPVLAVVRPDGLTAREVSRSGGGLVAPVGEPEIAVRSLEKLDLDPTLARELGERGKAYAAVELAPSAALARADCFLRTIARAGRDLG